MAILKLSVRALPHVELESNDKLGVLVGLAGRVVNVRQQQLVAQPGLWPLHSVVGGRERDVERAKERWRRMGSEQGERTKQIRRRVLKLWAHCSAALRLYTSRPTDTRCLRSVRGWWVVLTFTVHGDQYLVVLSRNSSKIHLKRFQNNRLSLSFAFQLHQFGKETHASDNPNTTTTKTVWLIQNPTKHLQAKEKFQADSYCDTMKHFFSPNTKNREL